MGQKGPLSAVRPLTPVCMDPQTESFKTVLCSRVLKSIGYNQTHPNIIF